MLFSKPVAALLAVLLAVLQAVVLNIHGLSNDVNNVIAIVIIIVAALGVAPSAGAWFAMHLPAHLVAAFTALLVVLQALNQDTLHVGAVAHTVIAVVIVALAAMGVSPAGAGKTVSWLGDPSDQKHG